MTCGELPDGDNILRFVRHGLQRDDGWPDGSAFLANEGEMGLSVNWIEYFGHENKAQSIDEVRECIQRDRSATSIFAELNIEATKNRLDNEGYSIKLMHTPQPANERHGPDPSHSEILELPPFGSPHSEMIGDLIADECVIGKYPGRVP